MRMPVRKIGTGWPDRPTDRWTEMVTQYHTLQVMHADVRIRIQLTTSQNC